MAKRLLLVLCVALLPGCADSEQPSTNAPAEAASARAEAAMTIQVVGVEASASKAVILEGTSERAVRGVDFRVSVRLHNSGPATSMLTNFNSVFDGFALVIWDADAPADSGELQRIHYTHHQSPYAQDRPLPVPTGTTRATLSFPVQEWTARATRARVRLEGGLYGTAWPSGLRSNEVVVTLPKREG